MKHLLLFILSILAISSHSQNLISNGNFSGGWSNWTTNSDAQIWDNASFANSPTKYAPNPCDASGNRINNGNGELWQTVSFPNNTSTGTISFYSYISTEETTTTTGYDFLKVYIGSVLIATYSNLHSNSGYQSFSLNIPTSVINLYKGNSTDLSFKTTTDGAKRTIFRIDDVALNITTSSCTAVGLSVYPQDQSTSVGGSATFSLTTSGTAPFTYQWYRNGNSISGATSSSYTLSNCQSSDNGASFYCVCTNCNGANQIQSQTKYLTVNGGSTTGSVQVNLAPADAVTAGATWSIDGNGSYTSGQTISSISQGSHSITFSTISGFNTPSTQSINVTTGNTATTQGTYTKIQTNNDIDLTHTGMSIDSSSIKQGNYVYVNADYKNIGTSNATSVTVSFWLSDNCNGDISADFNLGTIQAFSLDANSTKNLTKQLSIPIDPKWLGNKFIKCWINYTKTIAESNYNNNLTCVPVYIKELSSSSIILSKTGKSHLLWPFYNKNDANAINPISQFEGQYNSWEEDPNQYNKKWRYSNDHCMASSKLNCSLAKCDKNDPSTYCHHSNCNQFAQDWNYSYQTADCYMSVYAPIGCKLIIDGSDSKLCPPACSHNNCKSGGNYLMFRVVKFGYEDFVFKILHLNYVNPDILKDKKVKYIPPGTFLGKIGATGVKNSYSHLHFVLYKDLKEDINPIESDPNTIKYAADLAFDAIIDDMGGDDTYEDSTEYFKTDIEDESTENTSMIQDVTSNFITIFPNPFNNKISIKMDSKIELIKIFDVLGKLVHSEIGQGNEQILNLSNLLIIDWAILR